MSLTLAALLHRAELGLQLRSGDPRIEVTWVHISDLADPTPYLEPGCMLLTTGLSLGDRAAEWTEYVAALSRVGVPALGFGVGLRHKRIPEELLAAAVQHGVALVEVPERTRFSEVIHVVVQIGARQDRAQHALVLDRHRELLKAAQTAPAHRSLVTRLQEQLTGWVLLLGRDLQVLAAAPSAARQHADRVRAELPPSAAASAVRFDRDAEQVIVLPIGSGRIAGWLAVGRDQPLTAAERTVVDATISLLQLDIARAAELLDAERRERRAVLDLILSGERDHAVRVADRLGVAIPDGRVQLAVFGPGPGAANDLLETLETSRSLQRASALVASGDDGTVIAIVPAAEVHLALLRRIVAGVADGRGVVAEVADPSDLPRIARRLTQTLMTAPVGELVELADDRGVGLLGQLHHESGHAWAEQLLQPLRSADARVDLLQTVRAYLAHNGSAEATASELGIHRRTLGYRLGKAEQALERSLADPSTRAELWVALQVASSD
jgi:purine catabolism regulator